jgi:Luciferase-like monooxygenase
MDRHSALSHPGRFQPQHARGCSDLGCIAYCLREVLAAVNGRRHYQQRPLRPPITGSGGLAAGRLAPAVTFVIVSFLKGPQMPHPGTALEKLGFLTIWLFDGEDPGPGHQYTLEMIQLAERLGFDSAWLRCRHLQYGISPRHLLAAAAQRTARSRRRGGQRCGSRGAWWPRKRSRPDRRSRCRPAARQPPWAAGASCHRAVRRGRSTPRPPRPNHDYRTDPADSQRPYPPEPFPTTHGDSRRPLASARPGRGG